MSWPQGCRVLQSHRRNTARDNVVKLWHSALPLPLYCPGLRALAPAQATELAASWHDPLAASRCIEAWIGQQRRTDLPDAAVVELVQLYELLERGLWMAGESSAIPGWSLDREAACAWRVGGSAGPGLR